MDELYNAIARLPYSPEQMDVQEDLLEANDEFLDKTSIAYIINLQKVGFQEAEIDEKIQMLVVEEFKQRALAELTKAGSLFSDPPSGSVSVG